MKRTCLIVLAVALLVVGQQLSGQSGGYSTKVHFTDNGNTLEVANGGSISVTGGTVNVSSGTVNVLSTATFKTDAIAEYTASGGVTIDGVTALDGEVKTTANAGSIVSTTGLTIAEYGNGTVHKTVIALANGTNCKIADTGANGAHAQVQLYDWPAGQILVLGSTCDLAFTAANTSGLTATATYDFGLGSAAAGVDNAALASTEQNVITKIEGDLSANAATLQSVNSTALILDGTSTPADLWLNAAFAADDASADQAATMTGTVTVTWVNLGDY